ncbi:hypothetical protein OAR19_00780, partial [bacterium]|nr:hypothetical protein [bacterium]
MKSLKGGVGKNTVAENVAQDISREKPRLGLGPANVLILDSDTGDDIAAHFFGKLRSELNLEADFKRPAAFKNLVCQNHGIHALVIPSDFSQFSDTVLEAYAYNLLKYIADNHIQYVICNFPKGKGKVIFFHIKLCGSRFIDFPFFIGDLRDNTINNVIEIKNDFYLASTGKFPKTNENKYKENLILTPAEQFHRFYYIVNKIDGSSNPKLYEKLLNLDSWGAGLRKRKLKKKYQDPTKNEEPKKFVPHCFLPASISIGDALAAGIPLFQYIQSNEDLNDPFVWKFMEGIQRI